MRTCTLPLSTRLHRQRKELERILTPVRVEVDVDPLLYLDPCRWGEQYFYIEDRYDPTTGRPLAPGSILLAPHQKTILRHALLQYVDIQAYIQSRLPASDYTCYVNAMCTRHTRSISNRYIQPCRGDGVAQNGIRAEYITNSTPICGTQQNNTRDNIDPPPPVGGDGDDGGGLYSIILYTTCSTTPPSPLSPDNVLPDDVSKRDIQDCIYIVPPTSDLIPYYTIEIPDTLTLDNLTADLLLQAIVIASTLYNKNNSMSNSACAIAHAYDPVSNRLPVELSQAGIQSACASYHINYDAVQTLCQVISGKRSGKATLLDIMRTSTRFRWSTIVYSCPKKSGKTRVAAMVASWLAWKSMKYSEIYCLANDGKQSADRVLNAVKRGIGLAPEGSIMKGWDDTRLKVELPGGQYIEAIPVDPEGEAGSQPTASFWSEMWGYSLSAKERLWTEMTIPPTRWGRAIRWVESYAGYEGDSPVLWNLYIQGVDEEEHPQGQGVKHPVIGDELPVYVNGRAGLFCYWDHKPRMIWQVEEYYQAEAALLTEDEFRRVHRNEWVSPLEQAIPIDRWDSLAEPLPPIGIREPIVLGVDLGVTGDHTALVVVSKHPHRPNDIAIRSVQTWEPHAGHKIDYSQTIAPALRAWCRDASGDRNHNVICIVYDMYQSLFMASELGIELGVWFEQFSQGKGRPEKPGRPVADKMFFDMVMAGRLAHDGNVILRQHVHNAAAKSTEEGRYMRFVKKRPDAKIDALVAASMAVCMISTLNV